ncbi:MAG: 4-(cytidine 5'-diphospho)-2-C-methyl-D-erythritol kinase [Clostridiales bacterium]|nr:4-(cytidine 5'-diphospho)-2-C-methyl-D-erythritol kinase [Clostridiales bacterium]
MKTSYDTTAFAKINLFLRCCGKYPNGYHRLYMLMQQIGIGDDILVELDDEREYVIELESGVDIPREKNLGYKAAKAFYDCYTDKLRAEAKPVPKFPYTFIRETKKVPSQAGLGGGSSDAAAVLQILQQHFGNPLTDEEMNATAAKLGADVPFFLFGGTCICEGVGEIVTELPDLSGVNIILVKPEVGVGTKECYELSDENPALFDEDAYREQMNAVFTDEKKLPVERIAQAAPFLVNDLQEPAVHLAPVIAELIDVVKNTGAVFSAMTGSGSCVFGIYEDEKSAGEAEAALQNDPRTSGCQIIPSVLI